MTDYVNLPSYQDLPGDGTANADRDGHKYKVYNHANSKGEPGTWHIYYDSKIPPIFVPEPQSSAPDPAPVPAPIAAAPAPTPVPDNQPSTVSAPGTSSSNPETTEVVPAQPIVTGQSPQPSGGPGNVPSYQEAVAQGSPIYTNHANNKEYVLVYHEGGGSATGVWHIYKDGEKDFMKGEVPFDTLKKNGYPVQTDASGQQYVSIQAFDQDGKAKKGAEIIYSNGQTKYDSNGSVVLPFLPSGGGSGDPSSQTAPVIAANGGVAAPDNSGPAQSDTTNTPVTVASAGPASSAPPTDAVPVRSDADNRSLNFGTGTGSTYTVQSGDSLSSIAAAHNMTLNELLKENPQFASNPDLIHPGESVHFGSVTETSTPITGNLGDGTNGAQYPPASDYNHVPMDHTPAHNPNDVAQNYGGWADGGASNPPDPALHAIGDGTPDHVDSNPAQAHHDSRQKHAGSGDSGATVISPPA